MHRRVSVLAVLLTAVWVTGARAQESRSVPGPFVFDLRGVMSGLPTSPEFYPAVGPNTLVPERGFGVEAGVHVFPLSWGPARFGIGASFYRTRGSISGTSAVLTGIAPQVSANFGTRDGWSYLSAGYGPMRAETTLAGDSKTLESSLNGINLGGGARWFLSRHLATTFDLRFFLVSGDATPSATLFAASAGFAIR